MMPGETHSKVATEATSSCQNCTSLRQSLNEYVAALITIKQKIIDSDHLLADYQQKCDDLHYVKRENSTLKCQLEKKLLNLPRQEHNEKELISLRAELEEKAMALQVLQQAQSECVKVKEECERNDLAKKKLEAKLKKMKEAAERHAKDIKKLHLEKKIIAKELKKMQKKLDGIQNRKCRKVNNVKVQVANEHPVAKLNKKKIKILLEELWGCIESSTENGDAQLILETKLESSNLERPFDCTSSLIHSNPSGVCNKFNMSSESTYVYNSKEYKKKNTDDNVGVGELCEEIPQKVFKELNDICLLTSEHEHDMEGLVKILNWAKPLPRLLSPLKCSPLTRKCMFESTDSNDDELSNTTVINRIDCKILDNEQSFVENSSRVLSRTENAIESYKPSDGFGDNLESDSVAHAIKSKSRSNITSVGQVAKDRNNPETLVPLTQSGSMHNSREGIYDHVGNKISNNNADVASDPVTIEIKNIQGPETNKSSFGECPLPLNSHTSEYTEFLKDSFVHKSSPNEMIIKQCDITGSCHVHNIPSVGCIYARDNVKKNVKDLDNQEICSTSNDNYQLNSVQSSLFDQNRSVTDSGCRKSNCLERVNSVKFDTTSVNDGMPLSYINPEQKLMCLDNAHITVFKPEHADMLVHCNVKNIHFLPEFIQDIAVQKSMSAEQTSEKGEVGGHCFKESCDSAVCSDVESTSTLAEDMFNVDEVQVKRALNDLDLVAVDKENGLADTLTVKKPECKCVERKNADQQVSIIKPEEVREPKHDVRKTDSTGKSQNVTKQRLSDPVKLSPSCANSPKMSDLTKVQNIVLVKSLQIEKHINEICSHSEAGYDYPVFCEILNKTDGNKDLCGVSFDSEEEDNFLVRKVSNTRTGSNISNYCSGFLKNDKVCNVDLRQNSTLCNPVVTRLAHEMYGSDLPTNVGFKMESGSSKNEKDILIECNSVNVILDAENCSRSNEIVVKYDAADKNKQTEESAHLIECERLDDMVISEPNICITNAEFSHYCSENVSRKLPGKNLIWNFERTNDSFDPRDVLKNQKLNAKSEKLLGNASLKKEDIPKSLNPNVCVKHVVRKEENQQRISEDGHVSYMSQLGQTVLANTDSSTSSDHSPETIYEVRNKMGPPLPPLLGPLLATPPKMICHLSPNVSSSSHSSLPSPIDDLISPLPGTSFPSFMSTLFDCRKQSLAQNAVSSSEKANQNILSSPLQFCAATPKHALPVPGRLPVSASGNSATSENSVQILDTIYPELSARARTLNILKGNVQLNRGLPGDCKNIRVSQISGFKPITSNSTAFMKAGINPVTDNSKTKLSNCENQKTSSRNSSLNKRSTDSPLMPKSAKKLRLDSESVVMETVKDYSSISDKRIDVQKPSDSWHISELPDVVKDGSDDDVITNALKKIEDLCFDLLPVIHSHIFVGTIPKVPVMRKEEKEVIYEFSNSKKSLADRFLHVVLKKIRAAKDSVSTACLQALCRVYVGLCRQLGDIERARILCYSIIKEDFSDPDRLILFIVSAWNDILSTHGVVSKAIQAILKTLTAEEVGSCLGAYLSWEKTPSMNVNVLLSSVLMAIQLYPDVKFQQSEKYGEDLTDSVWEYVFALDLLCSHRKWVWTHDNVISKELWPLLDKWVKRKKGNPNVTFVPDIIVAAVLRLVGHLCQMGLKEGFVAAVKNISTVIITFLQHANEEGMPWGMQLACVYMLCDLAPSNPDTILKTLQIWRDASRNYIPPAIGICMQKAESACEFEK